MIKLDSVSFFFYLTCFYFLIQTSYGVPYEDIFESLDEYKLPELGFELSALEPFLAESTVKAHYLGHHASYTAKMNVVLKDWREKSSDDLPERSLFQILNNVEKVPAEFKNGIVNNAGGYVNHAFYWSIMSPNVERTLRYPGIGLEKEIEKDFGSFQKFKEEFSAESLKLFGSGYVWLVLNATGSNESLSITPSFNQDCPISKNLLPVLVIDIWEHAYYLQHQFRRASHIEDFWFLVDWQKVETLRSFWKQYLAASQIDQKVEL